MDCLRNIGKKIRLPGTTFIEDGLETYEEYKKRWISVRVIYFTMFLMSLGFSIILTGIWPYLDKLDPSAGKEFMGYIVGANPFGQMLFSPLFGWWSNRVSSIRLPLLCSLGLFTLASGAYSILEAVPSHARYWMLASRFFIGVSSANIAVCRSYLSAATRISERTGAVAMVSLAQVLGFIVGPGLQAAVTPLGPKGYSLIEGVVTLNMYTTAGWINVLMGIGNIIMFLPAVFQEKKIAAREVMILQGKTSEKETWKSIKPDYISAWTLIVAFFVLVFNFVLLETLGTPLTMEQFAWTHSEAMYYMGILMAGGAVVACVTFVAIGPLCKMFREQHVLIWGGFFLMVVGRLSYIPIGDSPPKLADVLYLTNETTHDENDPRYLGCPKTQEWCHYIPRLTFSQFILGYAFTSIGYPIGVTLIQTIFSKILGPRPQGLWMGLMTGSGCLSRVLGPVFVSVIYTRQGTYWTFGFTAVMMFVFMVWLIIFSKRLVPPTFDPPTVEMQILNATAKEKDLENNSNNTENTGLTEKSPQKQIT